MRISRNILASRLLFISFILAYTHSASAAECGTAACNYTVNLEQPGFYVAVVKLPSGAQEGFWGLEVNTSSGYNKGGFNSGAVLVEDGKYPGFTAFYLANAEPVKMTAYEYTGVSPTFKVSIQKQDPISGARAMVFGPTDATSGQPFVTPTLEPGFYVAEVFSQSGAQRGRFGIELNGDSFVGGVNIGGWIDAKTGGNGEGFGAFYITQAQTANFNLYYGNTYGSAGSAQPFLEVHYQQPDGTRQLVKRFGNSQPPNDTPWVGGSQALNDTGITWGGAYPEGNNSTCSGETISQQDCSHGRDVTHNDDSDGHAGFSFTKVDNGNCVQDNVTGLMWEVKTDDNGLHDKDDTYTWYDTNPATNGGADGVDRSSDSPASCYGYQAGNPATYCNTQAYVVRVNAAGWCGYNDWRMPNREELRSIVDYGRVESAIDINYFPNTVSDLYYWSSSAYAYYSDYAWGVYFHYGLDYSFNRNDSLHVRLVRGGQ